MFEYRKEHTIVRMAKVLDVSVSGYYKWKKRKDTLTTKDIEDMELEEEIIELFYAHKCIAGITKITAMINENREEGNKVNHKRVERLMKKNGLFSKTKKKFIVTTDSSGTKNPAPNLLNRDFTTTAPGQKTVQDVTYVQTGEGTLYVAVSLDLFGRYPVGLAMSTKNDKYLVVACLDEALANNRLKEECIMHSDRGSIYSSDIYRDKLKANGLVCSMSKKGDCWDNAPMESFFGKLKSEWLDKKPKTIAEAKRRVYEYVWDYYPKKRLHEALEYMTPYEYYTSGLKAA